MIHVFLSAHYDDAIGSCGGYMSDLVNTRNEVLLVTAFGGQYKKPLSSIAKELHKIWKTDDAVKMRKKENDQATHALGVESINFDIPEALYRVDNGDFLYCTYNSLYGPINKNDKPLENLIINSLKSICDRNSIIYFPIAHGHHVDHEILFNIGEYFNNDNYNVIYYNDFYYKKKRIIQDFEEINIKISKDGFMKKIMSFNYYESQIPMLFDSTQKAKEYFMTINNYKGELNEKYYKHKI